jgi:hypothetical protein
MSELPLLDGDPIVATVAQTLSLELQGGSENEVSRLSVRIAEAVLFDLAAAGYSVLTPQQAKALREQESA